MSPQRAVESEFGRPQPPSINAALVRAVWPSGVLGPKASGALLSVDDELFLLTNWHVATGRRWQTPAEQLVWSSENPNKIDWASDGQTQGAPAALRISIHVLGRQRDLVQIDIDDECADDLQPRYAWESPDEMIHERLMIPRHDLVCLHLGRGVGELNGRLAGAFRTRVRLGYSYWEVGRQHRPAVADQIFVVGYPSDIGTRETDPPVWTSGSIATDPLIEWEGERFLIDSRTREGQSGAAVIAYSAASGGMPSRYHLLGIYSGRIDGNADVGSVWWIDDLLEDLVSKRRRPKYAVRTANLALEMLLPDLPPPPEPEPADLSVLLDFLEKPTGDDRGPLD